MFSRIEEYFKHSALNFGQTLHGLRFLLTHPQVDRIAPPGTVRHIAHAIPLRLKRIGNDLFFTLIPPHWHHSREELDSLRQWPASHWFQCGYGPYRFTETGERRSDPERCPEPRWDPRCDDDA